MKEFLNKKFKLSERGSTIPKEIIGGLVTFLAVCYILPVNSAILSDCGMNAAGVYASTAITTAIITILMALLSNTPIALSAGMGLNAYIAYTVCGNMGYTWQEAMILQTLAGIVFFVISLTPLRKKIIEAFPKDLRHVISAGLGAFIAFVGLKGAKVIVDNPSTLVAFGSLSDPGVLLSVIGIVVVIGMMFVKTKKGILASLAIPLGMLVTAIIGLILYYATGSSNNDLPHVDFSSGWGMKGFEEVFLYGLFGSSTNGAVKGGDFWGVVLKVLKNPLTYAAVFSIVFVNLFNTTAVLFGVGKECGLVDETNGSIRGKGAFISDGVGALISAPMGTSYFTSFAESAIGIKCGTRTGLGGIMCGLLFAVAAIVFPVFEIFTYSCVNCAVLVGVGGIIFTNNLKELNWKDPAAAFSAFITAIMIVLTYSLTTGLGLGLIVYLSVILFSRRGKEVSPILYLIGAFYILSFAIDELIKKI